MKPIHSATFSLVAILFLVPLSAKAASLSTYVGTSVSYYGGSVADNDSADQAAAIDASASHADANFSGNADAFANIDFGLFQAYASTNATLQPVQPFAQGAGSSFGGSWDDIYVMNPVNAALLGTPGSATVSLLVDVDRLLNESGHSLADPNDYSIASVLYQYDIYVGDGYASGWLRDDSVDGPNIIGSFGAVQFNYSFIWGDAVDISASIYGESSVGLRTGVEGVNLASAVLDSQHTFAWQGLSNVQDEFGNLVDYSVTSDSGTDWSMAASTVVPVPAAIYLFGSGLALLGWFQRKKV